MTLIPTKKMLHKNMKTENNVTYLTDVQFLSQTAFFFLSSPNKTPRHPSGNTTFSPYMLTLFFSTIRDFIRQFQVSGCYHAPFLEIFLGTHCRSRAPHLRNAHRHY